jgi:uncharacterized membrane protein YdbT with pleckstrin-like domain
MKYPEKLLSKGEEIVFDVHHHPVVLWAPLLLVIVYTAVWLTLLFMADFLGSGWWLLGGAVLLLVLLAVLAWKIEVWLHVNLVLTNQRLIYRAGVLSRRAWEIPLSSISDVSLIQSAPGRVIGVGDLVIKSSTQSGKTPYFRLRRPDRLKQKILEQVHRATGVTVGGAPSVIAEEVARTIERTQPTHEIAAVPPERPPLYSEIVDQIERLEELRRRGVLSDEEFQKAKDDLLSRLGKEPGG